MPSIPWVSGLTVIKTDSQGHLPLSMNYELLCTKLKMIVVNFNVIFIKSIDSRGRPSPWSSSPKWSNPPFPPCLCVPTHRPPRSL